MNPNDPDQLPNPTLDPARRAAIIDEVLGAVPTSHRRPWLLPISAAAAVATIAVGGVALLGGEGSGRQQQDDAPVAAASPTAPTGPAPVPFTLGRLPAKDAAATLTACLDSLDRQPGDYEVGYAQRVRTESGAQGVVVARQDSTGTELLCAKDEQALIAGPMSKSVVVEPTRGEPIKLADGGGTSSMTDLGTGTTTQLSTTSTFRVAANVAHIDMRVGTDTAPGIWHRSAADHGFVHASAWIDTQVARGTDLYVETRAQDVNGKAITGGPLGRHLLHPQSLNRQPLQKHPKP